MAVKLTLKFVTNYILNIFIYIICSSPMAPKGGPSCLSHSCVATLPHSRLRAASLLHPPPSLKGQLRPLQLPLLQKRVRGAGGGGQGLRFLEGVGGDPLLALEGHPL